MLLKTISSITKNHKINYKNLDLLDSFITVHGKILPRRINGVTVQQQKKITKAIKQARILGLLPFIISNYI